MYGTLVDPSTFLSLVDSSFADMHLRAICLNGSRLSNGSALAKVRCD